MSPPLSAIAAPPITPPTGTAPPGGGSGDGGGPVVDASCRLLGGFSLILQAVMGVIVLLSLVVKRYREHPRRPWRIWILDVSKQLTGQVYVHICNVALSAAGAGAHAPHAPHAPRPTHTSAPAVARLLRRAAAVVADGPAQSSACSLYFLNIALDTTLGVLIIRAALAGLEWIVVDRLGLDGFQSGVYTPTPHALSDPHYMRLTHDDSVHISDVQPEAATTNASRDVNAADGSRACVQQKEALSGPLVLHQSRQPTVRRGGKAHARSATTEPLLERGFSDGFDSPGPSAQEDEGTLRQSRRDEEDLPGSSSLTGEGLKLSFWVRQALLYCLAVTVMKGAVTLLLAIFPFLITLGCAVLSLGSGHPRLQVLFVMALFPTVMNVLQFYMIDSFIRHTPVSPESGTASHPSPSIEHRGRSRSPTAPAEWTSAPPGSGFDLPSLSRDASTDPSAPRGRPPSKAADDEAHVTPTSYPPPRSLAST